MVELTLNVKAGFGRYKTFPKVRQFNFSHKWKLFMPFLENKEVQHSITRSMIRHCMFRNLEQARYPFDGSSVSQFIKDNSVWPGYGKCCSKQFKGWCAAHGLSWVEGTPLYCYSPYAENWYFKGCMSRRSMNPKKLHYYELWTGCHAVAPFVMALAKKVYPNKRWCLLKGQHHTVVINDPLTTVMDLLNFKKHSARWSINFALEHDKSRTKKYFSGISQYVV